MQGGSLIRLVLHLAYGKNNDRLHGKFVTSLEGRQLCISRQPLLDGARILLTEGVDPETPLVTRHAGDDYDAMISTVGEAAKWTVREDEKVGPKFDRWRPFPVTRRGSPSDLNERPAPRGLPPTPKRPLQLSRRSPHESVAANSAKSATIMSG
jgi:hypothetical protein